MIVTCLRTSYSTYIDLSADIDQQLQNINENRYLTSLFNFNKFAKAQILDEIQIRLRECE